MGHPSSSRALLSLGLLASASCGPPLEQVWELRNFRVLGIVADPPEPARGATTQLTLVSADVRTRAVQVAWFVCAAPTSATGGTGADAGTTGMLVAPGGCSMESLQLAFGSPATIRVPATGGSRDASGRDSLSVIGFACAGGTIGLPADGGTLPTCQGTDAQGWLFTRTLPIAPVMPQNPPNQNPVLTEVTLDGMAITDIAPPHVARCVNPTRDAPCPTHRIEVGFSAESREPYLSTDPLTRVTETRLERLTTGFVISGGLLEAGFRTDSTGAPMSRMANPWTPPTTPGAHQLVLYTFDGRGGFVSASRTLIVD